MEVTAPAQIPGQAAHQEAAAGADCAAQRQRIIAITRSPDDAAEFLGMARGKNIKAHALPTIQLISRGERIVGEFLDAVSAESPDYVVFMSSKAVRLLFDTARRCGSALDGEAGRTQGGSGRGGDDGGGDDGSNSNSISQDQAAEGAGARRDTVGSDEAAVADMAAAAKQSAAYEKLRLAVANMTVVAVGPKTREALEREGVRVNEMPPETYSSVGVGEVFTRLGAVGRKVIIPRSGASTPFLRELLAKIGLEVVELRLYDVCTFSDLAMWNEFRREFSAGLIDGIVFTSASSVRGFADIMSRDYDMDRLRGMLSRAAIVAIGPFTADELKRHKITGSVTSDVHTVPGAFDAIARELDTRRSTAGPEPRP